MAEHEFEIIQEDRIEELNTQVVRYRHRNGADLLSLSNEDENKVFGISFRTPPKDSTGIAHILEHSVLCGSRKYPSKEPFVELIKGSLNTFLNAFTYPDKTCYPVASQNLQDFYNLIDVYLDAVFYPRLTPQVLQQEGWHYELNDVDDPLVYKGVVFNEMKGAYSSPERALGDYVQYSLFPDTTYGVESGGHPRNIPDLMFPDFQAFHATHYHPANSRIFFYGDDDPKKRLQILEEYMAQFDPPESPTEAATSVDLQESFSKPKSVVQKYAVSADGGNGSAGSGQKHMVALNWMLSGEVNAETSLCLNILEHVLLGTPASPLRRALLESGLGEDLAGVGFEDELRQYYFSTGMKGVDGGKVDQVVQLITETLTKLADNGIEAGTLRAAVNSTEFRLRENNTGAYPRGLVLVLRSLTTWLHGGDPVTCIAFESSLRAVKERLDQPDYLEELIRRELLENPHRTVVELEPDPQLQEREEAQERARLDAARSQMSASDLEAAVADTKELKRRQETPDSEEALAALPHLQLSDLEPNIRKLPLEVEQVQGVDILHHDLFTNGIIYLDISFDLRTLPADFLSLVPLFGRALTEMGTERDNYVQLAQRIGAETGGIWPQSLICTSVDGDRSRARFLVRSKAMAGQAEQLLEIARDLLLSARFDDKDRFLQMALEEKAGLEAGLVPGGHRVVGLRLRSQFDESSWISEQISGITYLFYLRQLVEEIESNWSGVLDRLEEIRRRLINRTSMLCNLTTAAADRDRLSPLLARLIEEIPSSSLESEPWNPSFRRRWEGLTLPAQVNYVGKAFNLFDHGYKLHGSVSVIARTLSTTWLWDRVRVQGGAYGAFCLFDLFTGVLSCVSYRDPNLAGTLNVYDGASEFLKQAQLSGDELTKAVIGTLGDMDSYQLPDAKGYTSMVRYLSGITDEFRQQLRDEVLGTTTGDFLKFAQILDQFAANGQVVAMGSGDSLTALHSMNADDVQMLEVL